MTNETIGVEFKQKQGLAQKLLPLLLAILIIALDQISKVIIIKSIPANTIGFSFFGDLIRIIHVQNPGVAFSLGHSLASSARILMFAAAPLVVILIVLGIYFRNNTFTALQRWTICGIIGGGIGNLYDRFFRPDGVVDFIDVKFFGLFGLERWPTFNIADAAILICGFILIISFFISIKNEK